MAEFLYRLGQAAARHAGRVIGAWAALLVLAGAAFALFGGTLATSFSIPDTPTTAVTERLQSELPEASGGTASVVVQTEDGSKFTEEQQQAISALVTEAADVDGVENVVDPFVTEAQRAEQRDQIETGRGEIEAGREELEAAGSRAPAGAAEQLETQSAELEQGAAMLDMAAEIRTVSEDGSAAIVNVVFTESQLEIEQETKDALVAVFEDKPVEGVTVDYSADISAGVPSILGVGEVVGLVVAAVVLVVMLGSMIAAGLPLLTALIGVGIGALGAMAFSGVVEMASVTPVLGLMLGLAVGIDYSLFIINRHRTQLLQGMDLEESAGRATGTSGNAVLFAGLTVVIALAALAVPGLPFLTIMGLAAAGTVAVAILVALTLTPAFLGFIGNRILSKRAWARAADADARALAAAAPGTAVKAGQEKSRRWGRLVTRHPVVMLVLSVLLLGTMAVPAMDLRVGLPDGGSEPVDSTAYQAYDTLGEKFGEGINGPVIVVGYLPEGLTETESTDLQLDVVDSLTAIENVRTAVPASTSEDGSMVVFQVIPEEGPAAESTEELVHTIRADADEIKASTGVEVAITGQTGINIDVSDKLMEAMPVYLLIVVGLSLILLLLVFRSILVPLLATGGFLLSLAASFGAVVAVYQWGWLGNIFDVQNPAAVLSFLPIILIGVLFGLAMDYQMFLVSGMREAYVHGEDARTAVRTGFDHASRVVTAAAIIMVSVFAGFIFSHLTMVRPIGFALAIGVLLDAFVIRMTFIPAAMHLLGKSAWWIPAWLERILPDVDVEGAKLQAPEPQKQPLADGELAEAAR